MAHSQRAITRRSTHMTKSSPELFTSQRIAQCLMLAILTAVLVLKSWSIWSPANKVLEIGERAGGTQAAQCRVETPLDIELTYIRRDEQAQKCSIYWERHLMRGFYLHHYASLLDGIDATDRPPIIRSMRHQYGIGGRIIADAIYSMKATVTPQQYATASLWIGTFTLLLIARLPVALRADSENSYTAFIGLCAAATGSLSTSQLLVSPGFTPLRIAPLLGVMAACRLLEPHRRRPDRAHIRPTKATGIALLAISCLAMSIHFLIFTFVAIAVSYAYRIGAALRKKRRADSRSTLASEWRIYLLAPIITGLCLAVFLATSLNTADITNGSASDRVLNKSAFAILGSTALVCAMFFGPRLSAATGRRSGLVSVFGETSMLQVWLFAMYPAMYWGSPNHLYLFMLLATYPLSFVVSNMASGRSALPSRQEASALNATSANVCRITKRLSAVAMQAMSNSLFRRLEHTRRSHCGSSYTGLTRRAIDLTHPYTPRATYLLIPGIAVVGVLYCYASSASREVQNDMRTITKREATIGELFRDCKQQINLGIFKIDSCSGNAPKSDFVTFANRAADEASLKVRNLIASDAALFAKDYDFKGSAYGFPANMQVLLADNLEKRLLEESLLEYHRCARESSYGKAEMNSGVVDNSSCRRVIVEYTNELIDRMSAKISLREINSGTITVDHDLGKEMQQLYVHLYVAWTRSNMSLDKDSDKEIWAKLARQAWRSQLKQKLSADSSWEIVSSGD